jgi:hypothetical protein
MSISEVRIKSVPENERYYWLSIGGRYFVPDVLSWAILRNFFRKKEIYISINVPKFLKVIEKWGKNYFPTVKRIPKSILKAKDDDANCPRLSERDVRCELNFDRKGNHKVIIRIKGTARVAEFSVEELKNVLKLMALYMD